MKISASSILSNFIWRFFERIGAQLVGAIVSIVLARILLPSEYGVVALMNVFITILAVFVEGGFSSALIQKKDADDTDFSSVFYMQMGLCIGLYIILFFVSPLIANFYNQPDMKTMMKVLGLTLIIAGVKNIQIAYVSRHMMFRKFFFATLGGTIGAAVVGIGMAIAGCGAWALVGQSLFNNTVDTIILWVTVEWRPKRCFSISRVKELFSYGWKLLVSALLDTGYNNLRSLVIGKIYSSSDLAYFDQGNKWPFLVISNVNTSIDSVLLPSMSSAQDNKVRVKNMTRRAIKMSTYIMAPLLMGLAFCGEPVVKILLTEKWLPCVPFMRIFCITYMFYPIHTANLNAIKAMGRSDLFLKLEIIKKAYGILLLIISAPISVMAMGYSLLVSSVLSQIVNTWPNKKLLDYSYLEQLKDIAPGILLAVFMGACVYWLKFLPLNSGMILIIQILLVALIYLGGSYIFKMESYVYICDLIKGYIKRK